MTQGSWDWQPAALSAGQEAGLPQIERTVPSHRGYFLDAQDLMGLGGAGGSLGLASHPCHTQRTWSPRGQTGSKTWAHVSLL